MRTHRDSLSTTARADAQRWFSRLEHVDSVERLRDGFPDEAWRGLTRAHVQLIVDRMNLLGRNRKQVAERCGIDASNFTHWLSGNTIPQGSTLRLLNTILGLELDARPSDISSVNWTLRCVGQWIARHVLGTSREHRRFLPVDEFHLLAAGNSVCDECSINDTSRLFAALPVELISLLTHVTRSDFDRIWSEYGLAFRLACVEAEQTVAHGADGAILAGGRPRES